MKITMVPNFKRSAVKRKIVRNLVVAICLVSLLSVTRVHAQSTTLSVSPPVVEILLAPNKKVSQNFQLETAGQNVTVKTELHLAKPMDESGHASIDPEVLRPSAIPLIVTMTGPSTSPTLTFEAASTDIVQDVYLALVFQVESVNINSSATTPAISALILVTINPSGVTPIDLSIENFSLPLFHDSYYPLTINPTLKNQIPVMIRPTGKYEVIDPFGKTINTLNLYPNLVLGDSSRQIQSTIHDLPSPLTWSPTWKNLGPHRLRLTITTEGGSKITEVEKIIWIFPIRLIISLILTIIFLLTFFVIKNRAKPKKSLDS